MNNFRDLTSSPALRISLIYMLAAGAWFIVSDLLLVSVAGHQAYAHMLNDLMALLFTTALLYALLRWFELRQEAQARRYEYLGKYSNYIVLLVDEQGRIVDCNHRALAAYGYTRQEMLAMHATDLCTGGEETAFEENWQSIGHDGGRVYETVHRRKNGSSFAVEVGVRAVRLEDRELFQAIIRDITERKKVEQALRASEEKFRRMMETTPVGSYVIQDLVFKYVNPAMAKMFGYTPEEIIDRLGPLDLLVPEERERVSRGLRDRALGVPSDPYEVRSLRRDGSTFDSLVWGTAFKYEGRPASVGTLIDITERKRAEVELRKLSSAIEQTASTVVITDRDGNIEYVNPRFSETTGYSAKEAIGQNPRLLKSGYTTDEEYRILWQTITAGHTWKGEFQNKRKDGTLYWESSIISPVQDERGVISHFVAVKDDITLQKASTEKIEYLSHFDTLTGLPNQLALRDRLKQAIAVASRSKGELAVVFFDLDRFKNINDALGHDAGDSLLQELAQRLRHCFRTADTVARLSGDEIVAVLPDTGPGGAAHVGEKLQRLMQEPFIFNGKQYTLTASIGISLFPGDGEDVETLLRSADTAMHHVKSLGGNNYQFFTANMNAAVLQRMTVENELRQGIERGELALFFQPQVRVSDGVINGVEALVRWRHPQRGLVPPAEFIPIAEESGLIVEVGEWVLREACRQAKLWQNAGLPAIKVAVNLSALQFRRRNVLEQVHEALTESKLDPQWLELELTESVILQEVDVVLEIVRQLGEIGLTVSIDDFGTGYSSLSYLRKFPIDKLKIDQSFMREVLSSPEDAEIVRAIIDMAHNLHLEVVAEGVETEAQYEFIRSMECDQMQGYYCAKPMPSVEFARMLTEGCTLPRR